MIKANSSLLDAMGDPARMLSMESSDLDLLLRCARRAGLLQRLALLSEDVGLDEQLGQQVRDRMVAARMQTEQHARVIRWEVNRVLRALRGMDVRVILLKGAAYVMAKLPPGRGRLVSDVDVLVPRGQLDDVEQALIRAGWETCKTHPYDQRYYRRWMHELPPLQHRDRRTLLDVHHTIVPPTARVSPDADKLQAAARRIDDEGLWVLSPEDMVLHAATHLFHDGDLSNGLRDLFDLDDLFRHFGKVESGFWERLPARAAELDLLRPLYYASRYCRTLLGTPLPDSIDTANRGDHPGWLVGPIMDRLTVLALTGDNGREVARGTGLARWLLRVRSHWLRMPPGLLIPHLARKWWRRLGSQESSGA
jgi:hypothetical protein